MSSEGFRAYIYISREIVLSNSSFHYKSKWDMGIKQHTTPEARQKQGRSKAEALFTDTRSFTMIIAELNMLSKDA